MVRNNSDTIQVGIRIPLDVIRWIDEHGENLVPPIYRGDIRLGRQGLRQAVIRELLKQAMAQG
jgi:hypothetical protein